MDPYSLLGQVFADIAPTLASGSASDPDDHIIVDLDAEEYEASIPGLDPGVLYTVQFGCRKYDSDEMQISDVVKISTKPLTYNLTATKVAEGGAGVHFHLKMNEGDGLAGGKGDVELLIGTTRKGSVAINFKKAYSSGGWDGYIELSEPIGTSNFTLSLSGLEIDGNPVSLRPDSLDAQSYTNPSFATYAVPDKAESEPKSNDTGTTPKAETPPSTPETTEGGI
jgi:hypothetical protein